MSNKYYYFLSIIFIFLIIGNFCFARELEVKLPGLSDKTDIVQYRNILFNFLVGLGAGLAILSLTIGAIQLMASAGSPEASGNAKKRIIGSILGLIILFSSHLIMRTINPELTKLSKIEEMPLPYSIFLTDGKTETPCSPSINDTSQLLADGFNKITYKCAKGIDADKQPVLWVRKFKETDLGDWLNGTVDEKQCGNEASIPGFKSFKLDIERPGLYLYSKAGANPSNSRSMQVLSSQTEIDELYKNNTRSFEIINDPDKKIYYGTIFHTGIKFEGKCFMRYSKEKSFSSDLPPDFLASSFEFFRWNADNWKTSGDGVVFYSRPFGWTYGANDAGISKYSKEDIAYGGIIYNRGEAPKFDWKGVAGATEADKERCKTFFDCPGSIKINGDYLVVLMAGKMENENIYFCQTLYSSDKIAINLETSWLLKKEVVGKNFDSIIILPLK